MISFFSNLSDLDPDVYALSQVEQERQQRKLILIPREHRSASSPRRDGFGVPEPVCRRLSR
jgi:hypothetical protein